MTHNSPLRESASGDILTGGVALINEKNRGLFGMLAIHSDKSFSPGKYRQLLVTIFGGNFCLDPFHKETPPRTLKIQEHVNVSAKNNGS